MLVKGHLNSNPDIERLIREILKEDVRFTQEMRSVHREQLILPVRLKPSSSDDFMAAFTRNISPLGACLVTDVPIEPKVTATIEIYRLNEKVSSIVAESRWCKGYGAMFYMSGWQFLRLQN